MQMVYRDRRLECVDDALGGHVVDVDDRVRAGGDELAGLVVEGEQGLNDGVVFEGGEEAWG